MKLKADLYIILIMTFAVACSSDKQSSDGLPFIDVTKDYPEKEFILTDIADVTYLHLDTENEEFIYSESPGGSINSFTKNTIVLFEMGSGSVLFFSRDGHPKSRFNRVGQGPEEYLLHATTILYNEEADDVYIAPIISNFIQVYSSEGEYKRRLTLPEGVSASQIFSFDEQSLLVSSHNWLFSMKQRALGESTTSYSDSTFILISKTDGKVLDYIIVPGDTIDVSESYSISKKTGEKRIVARTVEHIIKCTDGFLLCNPETDTVFFFGKDKLLTPVMHKIPLIHDLDPKIVLENYIDFGQYQLLSTFPINYDQEKKVFIRDKKTGEIFLPKVVLPDYKGKELLFRMRNKSFHENEYHFELNLIELKQAYRENKLGGKLKELVATLDEYEDNNVFMFVNFRSNDF